MNKLIQSLLVASFLFSTVPDRAFAQSSARKLGIAIGVMSPGEKNAITDVSGVAVGHTTLMKDDHIRTGVTAIIPHQGNIFQNKVPAAIYVGNGFGKLAGSTQVDELGNLETPIILTNTLSVSTGISAVIEYTLSQEGNETVQSVNALVGETNDGYLNDIRGRHVSVQDVLQALNQASTGTVQEGNVGAGTGTICFGFKGGIGTSSRKLPQDLGGYTVGVLVQSNFGGVLQINGAPIGQELERYLFKNEIESVDGSCMIVVATDAPLNERNLKRLASRAMLGLGKTGGIASNGSGDYVIAFSTYEKNFIPNQSRKKQIYQPDLLLNDQISPLFLAVIEATEEAIINSLFAAEDIIGKDQRKVFALPKEQVVTLMKKYHKVTPD